METYILQEDIKSLKDGTGIQKQQIYFQQDTIKVLKN